MRMMKYRISFKTVTRQQRGNVSGGLDMDYQLDIQQANGLDLLNWFSSGAQEVAAHKKYLNDINSYNFV